MLAGFRFKEYEMNEVTISWSKNHYLYIYHLSIYLYEAYVYALKVLKVDFKLLSGLHILLTEHAALAGT